MIDQAASAVNRKRPITLWFCFVLLMVLLATRVFGQQPHDDATPVEPISVGTNLNGITDWSTSFPFVDLFKSSRDWISGNTDGTWDDGRSVEVDEHGWVTRLKPQQIVRSILLADDLPVYLNGRFLVLYEGDGTINYRGSIRFHPDLSIPGRHVIDIEPRSGNTWLEITRIDPNNHLRSIHIVRPDDELTFHKKVFTPEFVQSLEGMQVIRFMDWVRTNETPLSEWGDRPKVNDARWSSNRGVPFEVMIELANRLDADPWICVPHLANDDFVRRMAVLITAKLESGRRLFVEHSNEVWNAIFPQAHYAQQQGLEMGLSEDAWQAGWFYHSKRSVAIFRIFHDVPRRRQSHEIVRVMGGFNAVAWGSEQALVFQDAYLETDALAVAPYFGGALGSEDRGEQTRQWGIDQLVDVLRDESIPQTLDSAAANKTIADKYDVDLIAYEGGKILVASGRWQNDQVLNDLFDAVNRHDAMGELYDRFFDGWIDLGGRDWLNFTHCGRYSKYGRWGVLEWITQPIDEAPKYRAVQRFVERMRPKANRR